MYASATTNSLGPAELQRVTADVAANTIVIDAYANTIRDTVLPDVPSVHTELRSAVQKHGQTAKANAKEWLYTIKPQLAKTNEAIIAYNDTFQQHYDTLRSAVEKEDVPQIEKEVKQLYESVLQNKGEVEAVVEKITAFRNKLAEDTKNFKESANQLTSVLASTNASIPALQREIEQQNAIIKSGNILIGTGSALCALIVGCIAGGPMIADGVNKKKEANAAIEKIKNRISITEREVVLLTDLKQKLTDMTAMIDAAITSLQNVANNWHTIGAKYHTLLKNIHVISPEELLFIKEDLQTAKDSWYELKKYAEQVQG